MLVEKPGNTTGFSPDDQSAPPALSIEDRVEHYRAAFADNVSQDVGVAAVLSFDTRLVLIRRRVTAAPRFACLGARV